MNDVEAIVTWMRNLAGLPGDKVLIKALADAIERRDWAAGRNTGKFRKAEPVADSNITHWRRPA
jgi:hypothetical protein